MRMNQTKMIEDISMRSKIDCIDVALVDSKKRKRRISSSGQKEVGGVLQQIAKTVARRQQTTKCDKPIGERVEHMTGDRMERLQNHGFNSTDIEIETSTTRNDLETYGNDKTAKKDERMDTINQIPPESSKIQGDKENVPNSNSLNLHGESVTEKSVDFDLPNPSKKQRREMRGSLKQDISSQGATDLSISSNDDSDFQIKNKLKEKTYLPLNSTEATSKRQWHCSYCTFLNDDWNKRRCTVCTKRRVPTVVPYSKVEASSSQEIHDNIVEIHPKVREDGGCKLTICQKQTGGVPTSEEMIEEVALTARNENLGSETMIYRKDNDIETSNEILITTQISLTKEIRPKPRTTQTRKSRKRTSDVNNNNDRNKELSFSQPKINCEIEESELKERLDSTTPTCSINISSLKPLEMKGSFDPSVIVSGPSDIEVRQTVPLQSENVLSQAGCRSDSNDTNDLDVKCSIESLKATVAQLNGRLENLFGIITENNLIHHQQYNLIIQNQNNMLNRLLNALDHSKSTNEIPSIQLEGSISNKDEIPVDRNGLAELPKNRFDTNGLPFAELKSNNERYQDPIILTERSLVGKIVDIGHSVANASLAQCQLRIEGRETSKTSSEGKLSFVAESSKSIAMIDGQKTKYDLSQSLLTHHDASQCKISTPSRDKEILTARSSVCKTMDSTRTTTTAAATEELSLSQANSTQTIDVDETVCTPTMLSPSTSYPYRTRRLIAQGGDHQQSIPSTPKPRVLEDGQKYDLDTIEKSTDHLTRLHSTKVDQQQQTHSPKVSFSTKSKEKIRIPDEIEQRSNEETYHGQETGSKKDILCSGSNSSNKSRNKPSMNNSTTCRQSWVSNRPCRKFILELEDVTREKLSPTLDSSINACTRPIIPSMNTTGWHSKRASCERGAIDTVTVSGDKRHNSRNDPKGDFEDELKDQSYVRTLDEPTYAYKETVRCKATREGLPCYDCNLCRAFFRVLQKTGHELTYSQQNHLTGHAPGKESPTAQNGSNSVYQKFSRHRALHPPEDTPADFWELDFIDEIPGRNEGSEVVKDKNV